MLTYLLNYKNIFMASLNNLRPGLPRFYSKISPNAEQEDLMCRIYNKETETKQHILEECKNLNKEDGTTAKKEDTFNSSLVNLISEKYPWWPT